VWQAVHYADVSTCRSETLSSRPHATLTTRLDAAAAKLRIESLARTLSLLAPFLGPGDVSQSLDEVQRMVIAIALPPFDADVIREGLEAGLDALAYSSQSPSSAHLGLAPDMFSTTAAMLADALLMSTNATDADAPLLSRLTATDALLTTAADRGVNQAGFPTLSAARVLLRQGHRPATALVSPLSPSDSLQDTAVVFFQTGGMLQLPPPPSKDSQPAVQVGGALYLGSAKTVALHADLSLPLWLWADAAHADSWAQLTVILQANIGLDTMIHAIELDPTATDKGSTAFLTALDVNGTALGSPLVVSVQCRPLAHNSPGEADQAVVCSDARLYMDHVECTCGSGTAGRLLAIPVLTVEEANVPSDAASAAQWADALLWLGCIVGAVMLVAATRLLFLATRLGGVYRTLAMDSASLHVVLALSGMAVAAGGHPDAVTLPLLCDCVSGTLIATSLAALAINVWNASALQRMAALWHTRDASWHRVPTGRRYAPLIFFLLAAGATAALSPLGLADGAAERCYPVEGSAVFIAMLAMQATLLLPFLLHLLSTIGKCTYTMPPVVREISQVR
jgi:hypothetical protein